MFNCLTEMSVLNTVSSDGTCNKCTKKVNGNDVCCIICKMKFHATGCSNDTDICTQSFLNQFKPHAEKMSVKYAARPGNFMFMCDPCKTTFEINSASKDQCKVDMLEEKVDKLENGLKDIRDLLLNSNYTEKVRHNHEYISTSSNSFQTAANNNSNNIAHCAWGAMEDGPKEHVPAPLLNDSIAQYPRNDRDATSTLILPAAGDEAHQKQQVKRINKVAVERKVSIAKSFKKKNGDMVIVCNSRETRDSLKGHIKDTIPEIEVISSNSNCKYTIAVVGFDNNYCGNDIVSTLIDQSFFLKAFFSIEKVDEHIKYVDTQPLRNNADLFQSTFKVSKDIRQLLKKHGDRLIVGIVSCKVYDIVFVKRCAICQNYGDFLARCPCKDGPYCALCGDKHETVNCPSPDSPDKKCINCLRNKLESINHAAFSKQCPIFKRELEICTRTHAASLN